MAIVKTELAWKLSTATGPGDSTAQTDPNLSIGGFMSSTAWAGGVVHDLFDAISGAKNTASDIEYRCVFVHNINASLALQGPVLFVPSEVAGGANAAIGLDPVGVVSAASATTQAERVADEGAAPAGVTFSTPADEATGLVVADIPAGSCVGIWIRRSATNSGAMNSDGVSVRISGDTAA